MMRMFKAGDRVRHIITGRTMVVQKYIKTYNFLTGWQQSDTLVECSWYDPVKGYQKDVFDQRNLVKTHNLPICLPGHLNRQHNQRVNQENQ